MREIKFRAWDIDNFYMYYQDQEHDTGIGLIIWCLGENNVYFEAPELINVCDGGIYHDQRIEYRAPNQSIMQYTGLIDWYEGDIIKCQGLIFPITVDDYHGYRFMFGKEQLDKGIAHYGEKIGNIYEHPYLINPPEDAA